MARSVKTWYVLLAVQAAAYMPIWRWYLARTADGSDEPWGFIALAAALIVILVNRTGHAPRDSDLFLPSVLIVAYAATYSFVPRLGQAMIALTALSCTASVIVPGVRVHVPTLGLLVLSLPLVPSLQFYLGYPFRVLCGALTAPLLQSAGLDVVREGTSLRFGTQLVSIDAPCSGVKMLWAALFLAFLLSSLFRSSPLRTILTAGASVGAVLLGNVWRSAALFHLQSGMLAMPEWSHDAVGVCVFAGVAVFILWFADRMGNRGPTGTGAPDSDRQSWRRFLPRYACRFGGVS